ncbi:heterokaryon incompatibility protein-domain-containing protein [Boeremia exigua]|uniref:heterokaryon incompatibility protein-domain-containing protein n=1 Tax=Boeremia exigua TaxID=749465 RepID=UPI001E8E6780|nr:heterokaryon incompatibility protein-domain-containing protein [Boeremia exigua]KAH6612384.1 heterokaryon incompatibility protein-domain-containing protein [Boeremia exigua]
MTATSRVQYVYPALVASQIRILILNPSFNHDAPLEFSFHCVDLEDVQGRYEAISYTWGEPSLDSVLLHQDGSHVLVTPNLDFALRRLRYRLDKRWLWADAACIDQVNPREKALQIPLMDRIYRGANRVLVWLGRGGGDDEIGMRLLGNLSLVPKRTVPRPTSDPGGAGFSSTQSVEEMRCIQQVFELPWFRRVWTIQECVLNVDAVLMCGQTELSMARVLAGMRIIRSTDRMKQINYSLGFEAFGNTADLWTTYALIEADNEPQLHTQSSKFDILSLVHRFSGHHCSDDRDRIFGLYALASNIAPATLGDAEVPRSHGVVYLDVNYTFDTQATYFDFAIACMKNNMTVRILASALQRLGPSDQPGWPSWLPDWRVTPKPLVALSEYCSSKHIIYMSFAGEIRDQKVKLQAGWQPVIDFKGPRPCRARFATIAVTSKTATTAYLEDCLSSALNVRGPSFDPKDRFARDPARRLFHMLYRFLHQDTPELTDSCGWIENLLTDWRSGRAVSPTSDECKTLLPDSLAKMTSHRSFFGACDPAFDWDEATAYTAGEPMYGWGPDTIEEGDELIIVSGGDPIHPMERGIGSWHPNPIMYDYYALVVRRVCDTDSSQPSESDSDTSSDTENHSLLQSDDDTISSHRSSSPYSPSSEPRETRSRSWTDLTWNYKAGVASYRLVGDAYLCSSAKSNLDHDYTTSQVSIWME